jgi:hypothetical protein
LPPLFPDLSFFRFEFSPRSSRHGIPAIMSVGMSPFKIYMAQ